MGPLAGQRTAWRAEVIAQAAVDDADDELDRTVAVLAAELEHLDGRDSACSQRYFLRLGLESELERVREWPRQQRPASRPDVRWVRCGGPAALVDPQE